MINLRTTTAKRREAAIQVRIALALESGLARKVRVELKRAANEAAAHYESTGHATGPWLQAHREHMGRLLGLAYRASIRAMFERALTAAPKHALSLARKDRPANGVDVDQAIRDYISTHAAARAHGISDTTRDLIAEAVQEGVDEDLSYAEVAKLIEQRVGGAAAERADLIARTETHGAMQYGSLVGAQASGADIRRKEWVAVSDARTRDDHAEASGQVVDIDEPFEVGDEELDYPGDPSGSPENTINCRCAMVYHTGETASQSDDEGDDA